MAQADFPESSQANPEQIPSLSQGNEIVEEEALISQQEEINNIPAAKTRGERPDTRLMDGNEIVEEEVLISQQEEINNIPVANIRGGRPDTRLIDGNEIVEEEVLISQQEEINNIPVANTRGGRPDTRLMDGNEIVEEEVLISQQEEINNIPVANTRRGRPDTRLMKIGQTREEYIRIGVPLYEASVRCDWKVAKGIIDKYPEMELVRCSITGNGETSLHIAASAKGDPKDFVKNLMEKMTIEDLELRNNNSNTALYLAAVAGNLETVKIMVEKNRKLVTIPGGKETSLMPLYTAALCGNYDVVKYLYEKSNNLCHEDGWTDEHRGWLLEKCVENDMFDIALEMVKKYPKLGSGNVLRVLARKPEAFHEARSNIIQKAMKLGRHLYSLFITRQPSENRLPEVSNGSAPEENHPEVGNGSAAEDNHREAGNGSAPEDLAQNSEASSETKPNSIWRTIKSVFACIGLKVAPQKESNALLLLRLIWGEIAKDHKYKIDDILRGPPDSIMQDDKTLSGWAVAMQLENLISEHVADMEAERTNQITRHPDSTDQDTISADQAAARQLQQRMSKHLVNLHAETQKITRLPNSIKRDNQLGDQALEPQNLIFKCIANTFDKTQKLMKNNISLGNQVHKLGEVISEHNKNMRNTIKKETYSSRVVFIAAEMGNTNFLVELIRQYPDLIWKLNDNNQSIFHIAVKHRHEGIYNLLYEIGAMKDLITPLRDAKDNNMLHLVGKIAKQKRLEDVSGVAFQMQRELLWFHEVKNMIPQSYRERKNEDGLTPHELFRMEHKELVSEGEKWMKGTANRCLVVAALIATIVFAAAFTIPGGYSQTRGIPFFHSRATFIIFVVADAISLFLSTASILIFLSILTSRYAESDFLESLPQKLVSGLVTLFLSITTMTVAFGVSFFVLYHKGLLWIPIVICVFSVLPALLYVWLQYGLFIDVIRSTYRSRYLFNPEKHVLYYKNPVV